MRRRVWLLFAVTALAVASLAMGTSGFSAADIDRSVSISVADGHEEAAVPLADPGEEGSHRAPAWVDDESDLREVPVRNASRNVPLFLVHNRFETPMTVDAQVVESGVVDVTDVEARSLRPGGTEVVTGSVDCGGYAGRTTAELAVTATTEGMTAHINYRVGLVCAKKTPTPEQDETESED